MLLIYLELHLVLNTRDNGFSKINIKVQGSRFFICQTNITVYSYVDENLVSQASPTVQHKTQICDIAPKCISCTYLYQRIVAVGYYIH